jgi:putative redox protein
MLFTSGQHALVADEPPDRGGDGLGPTPFELLLGALGGCTAVTLQMYAANKGWDLAAITVQVTRDRHHEHEETDEGPMIEDIHVEIRMQGDLDAAQRRRLLEIAGHCPVNRALLGAARITEELVEGGATG